MLSSQHKCFNFILDYPVSNSFLKREKGKLPYSVFKATTKEIRFMRSIFKGRAPTVFFVYPSYVPATQKYDQNVVKLYDRRSDEIEPLFMAFYISDRTHIYNAVVNTMKCNGFELIEKGDDFNLIWTGYIQIEDLNKLNKYQKVNHFPNSVHLGRKDLLWQNIYRMKLKYPLDFNITPHSWVLPDDFDEMNGILNSKLMQKKMLILKPNNSSCGRGIKVVQGSTKFLNKEDTIVSVYLDRPLLINEKKFDMRIYILVTSYNPLRVYIYNEGLARFATESYSNDPNILKNKFVHLTNFSINKRNVSKFVKNDGKKVKSRNEEDENLDDEDPEQENSSKWSLKFLKKYITRKFGAEK